MEIESIKIDTNKFIKDLDFKTINNYVAIDFQNDVYRNGKRIKLPTECSLNWPKVRLLANNNFILVDGNKPFKKNRALNNAWILNSSNEIESSLYIGDVQSFITTKKYIICAYSDIDTHSEFGPSGLSVFDYESNVLFKYYNNDYKSKKIQWWELYSFLCSREDVIYLQVYPGMSIVKFKLNNFESRVNYEMPTEKELNQNDFWNPKAFTKVGDDWYFITPDRDNVISKIFKMDSNKGIELFGTCRFSQTPKGMKDGMFILPIHTEGCEGEIELITL